MKAKVGGATRPWGGEGWGEGPMRKVGVGKCRNGGEVRDEAAAAGNVRIQSSGFARTAAAVPEPKAVRTGPDHRTKVGWTRVRVPVGSRPHCRRSLAVRKTEKQKINACGADTKGRHPN